jgi:hypothetical protein
MVNISTYVGTGTRKNRSFDYFLKSVFGSKKPPHQLHRYSILILNIRGLKKSRSGYWAEWLRMIAWLWRRSWCRAALAAAWLSARPLASSLSAFRLLFSTWDTTGKK